MLHKENKVGNKSEMKTAFGLTDLRVAIFCKYDQN